MKSSTIRLLLVITILFFQGVSSRTLAGGPSFRELQNVKLPFTPSTHWYSHTDDFKFFLCSTKADMLMLDGLTGKILWQRNFEKDFANKKFSNQFWNKSANVVLVYDEDSKKGVATKYFIDGATGKLLWSSDQFVSDLGDYELSAGFSNYYDERTNGVLLPTKETVNLVDVTSGKTIWSKAIAVTGKMKDFNCFIMTYYDLVKIITGKETSILLTVADGKEVTDFDSFFNKKKYLADRKHAKIIDIPEEEIYVLMITETNTAFSLFTGIDLPNLDMTFKAYNSKTNDLLWSKKYHINCAFDWVSKQNYFAKMHYAGGNLFVEHNPSPKPGTGLTVLNPKTGELKWEANFSASERKSSGLTKLLTTPYPAPDPITLNGKTYVVNKAKNIVSCYNADNGTMVWDSEKFPDAQKIPTLVIADGLLIMGYGGDELKCASITQDKGPNIERYEYNNKDKYGIIAYDTETGKVVWSNETIEKAAKDKFDFIAGLSLINGKLFCATDKNFFILDPKSGKVLNSVPVAKEKLGDAWKMYYFEKEKKIILNCDKGIVKIDPETAKVEGSVATPTVPFYQASKFMNADDAYQDYAIFTSGDGVKMTFKEFASIDLDKMVVRGVDDGDLLFYDIPHFSDGGEMYYKVDGGNIKIYAVK
ncbi:MAG: PQQ-binding-like beta-propeller repeat protein [Bacteroidales bacterium]